MEAGVGSINFEKMNVLATADTREQVIRDAPIMLCDL